MASSNNSALYEREFCNTSAGATPGRCAHLAGATILSPGLMFMAGFLGNIFALYTLYKTKNDVRSTKFYTLVAGLAFTDLIGILMTSPSTLAAYVNGRKWVGGDAHCKYHGFAMTCFGLATPLIICAMAVERFMALKCVFFYSSRCRNGTARGVICTLWVAVVLFGLLPLFGFGRFEKQYPGTWCFLDFHSSEAAYNVYGYMYAGANLLLILVMVICNGYVVVMLVKTTYLRKASLSSQRLSLSAERNDRGSRYRVPKEHSGQIEVQMIVLMVSITTVFVVCWAPLMIQIIVTMASGKVNFLLDLAAVRLASFNQTLDPWLYILLRRSLIQEIKKAGKYVCSKCCRAEKNDSSSVGQYAPVGEALNIHVCQVHGDVINNADIRIDANADDTLLPDVMKDVVNENSSKLPDVTDTSATSESQGHCSKYVCMIGKRTGQGTKDVSNDGIYVKFLFVSKSKDDESSKTPKQKSSEKDNSEISAAKCPAALKALTSVSTVQPTSTVSSAVTKETSIQSVEPGDTNAIHSEIILDSHQKQKPEIIRRTKSAT